MASITPTKACVPCRVRKTKCDAATAGLPCSGCVSRDCAEKPGEPADNGAATPRAQRQGLTTTATIPSRTQPPGAASLVWSRSPESSSVEKRQSLSHLHYFHILKEAVDDGALDDQDDKTGTPFDPADNDVQPWHKVPQLDDIDKEFLNKKGVFDLPPKPCLLAFVSSYFTIVDPYSPVVDKTDFVHAFESGTCSLFLLYAMLATTSLYAPRQVLEKCGLADRSAAQVTFASRATLLCDFQVESDALACLQGSLLMTRVLPEQQTDKDSNYWFYNALRLASKLQLYSHLNRSGKSDRNAGLYSRIAWSLYCRHVFHLVSEFRNAAYLSGLPVMETIKTSDWGVERIPREHQHIDPHVDLAQLMRPLDIWRASLATQLQLCDQPPNSSIHYLDLMGGSYRYEATLCRLIQRQLRSVDAPKSNSAKQRLRAAMLELDGITGKLLANGMMDKVPISLMTTIPALLALHLEAALDPSESELVRSMSRISISQAMLALNQLREIPAIKKAIPLFEMILSRKKLYDSAATSTAPRASAHGPQGGGTSTMPPRTQPSTELHDASEQSFDSFIQEFLEYDALDKWGFGQVDFSRLV
ncbi:hypothetical protein V2A60_003576 [Cordyceps javanica]